MVADRSLLVGSRRAQLQRRLLAWYRLMRRDLPWRRTRDPYRIWVSEVMLQQTQVATATPYYLRFIGRFPSLDHLANARESDVLAAWAGLGYYRRARHLHAAVREVVREHAGRVPEKAEAFADLPGVGRYTTGAVLSIAFGVPLPVLDGNVARVLARWCAKPWVVRNPRDARALWEVATALVPEREPGDWNQALMELGATVCTPRAPRCAECPVRASCRAFALGKPEAFPPPAVRRASVALRRAVAIVERRGRVLMARRAGALLDGLWEPPGVDVAAGAKPRTVLAAELRRLGLTARLEPTDRIVRHTITHRRISVEVWRAALTKPLAPRATLRYVDPDSPDAALTALARKLAARSGRRGPG
jgi:A/G-specific adenine glycosylase